MNDRRRMPGMRRLSGLFAGTVALPVPPLLMYAHARILGRLPSEEVWFAGGGNHGPWYGDLHGMLISAVYFGQLLLFLATLVMVPIASLTDRSWRTLLAGVCLVALQAASFWFGLVAYFWTVE